MPRYRTGNGRSAGACSARGWNDVNVREASLLMGAVVTDADAELFDKQIVDFSIDSRTVKAGELFFALSQQDYTRAGFNGDFADGHQYIANALSKGALAAVDRARPVTEDNGA